MTFLLIDCCRQLDLTFIKNSITESSSPGEIAKKNNMESRNSKMFNLPSSGL